MATQVEEDLWHLLKILAEFSGGPDDPNQGRYGLGGPQLADLTGLVPGRIEDAVAVLIGNGHISARYGNGTTPYSFASIALTPHGRLSYQKAAAVPDQRTARSEVATMPVPDPKKVFIIHGRNGAARVAVEHFLKALSLQPVDFDQLAADQGGSAFVGDIVRAGMEQGRGIVALFTPDEFAALRPDHRGAHDKSEETQRWQARPNVIFEAGMAFGMAPERTVLVTLGTDVALFSDVAGIHTVRLHNAVQSRGRLRQKLIGMGCEIDQRTDAWTDPARSGDFEACIAQLAGVSARDPFRR